MLHGQEMGLRGFQERGNKRYDDRGARFEVRTDAPTIFQNGHFGERVEWLSLCQGESYVA